MDKVAAAHLRTIARNRFGATTHQEAQSFVTVSQMQNDWYNTYTATRAMRERAVMKDHSFNAHMDARDTFYHERMIANRFANDVAYITRLTRR